MLTVYIKDYCAYCRKVLDFATSSSIALLPKNIYSDPKVKEELIARGGKQQVPYLVDDATGVEMYESEDIIEYLKAKHVTKSPGIPG